MITPRHNPVLCWHLCLKLERQAKRDRNTRHLRKARKLRGIATAVSLWD
jgi:hypothetical protein